MNLDRIAAVILASGFSQRFGTNDKLLSDLDGQPLAAHSAAQVSTLPFHSATAIVPAGNSQLIRLYKDAGIEPVENDNAALGQGASLALAINHIRKRPVDAALILLADMPFVTPGHIQKLAGCMDDHDAVASRHNDVPQPPLLFARSTFDALVTLSGDKGGKAFLATLRNKAFVDMPSREATDIDTPEALAQAQTLLK
ncbi:MAG: nucleotidyltransferase family protein [Pseudomonadota bacterium]